MNVEKNIPEAPPPSGVTEKIESHPTFDEQWEHPDKLVFTDRESESEVGFYDIQPESLKTKIPTAMLGGWGGTAEMYRENMRSLVTAGRRAFSVTAPHGIDYDKAEFSLEDVDNIPDAELRKIAALINSLEEKQIKKIDAIGHSEGCLDIILAATLYPERFRDIVLVNPAGMIGKDNPWRLATSFAREVVKGYVDEVRKNGLSEPMLRAIRETTTAVINDPVQSFREVLALSNAQIHELLIGLREKGIGISIVSAVDDGVFPDKRMQEIVTKDMVDGYFTVSGHHAQFQLDAERYTQLADYALEMMQQKRERSQQPQGTVLENVEVIPEG